MSTSGERPDEIAAQLVKYCCQALRGLCSDSSLVTQSLALSPARATDACLASLEWPSNAVDGGHSTTSDTKVGLVCGTPGSECNSDVVGAQLGQPQGPAIDASSHECISCVADSSAGQNMSGEIHIARLRQAWQTLDIWRRDLIDTGFSAIQRRLSTWRAVRDLLTALATLLSSASVANHLDPAIMKGITDYRLKVKGCRAAASSASPELTSSDSEDSDVEDSSEDTDLDGFVSEACHLIDCLVEISPALHPADLDIATPRGSNKPHAVVFVAPADVQPVQRTLGATGPPRPAPLPVNEHGEKPRPHKCPVRTCAYHRKGFAKKNGLNRHTLTHYGKTMYCGFCPAHPAFSRVSAFKKHLWETHKLWESNTAEQVFGPDLPGQTTKACPECENSFSAIKLFRHVNECMVRAVGRAADGNVENNTFMQPPGSSAIACYPFGSTYLEPSTSARSALSYLTNNSHDSAYYSEIPAAPADPKAAIDLQDWPDSGPSFLPDEGLVDLDDSNTYGAGQSFAFDHVLHLVPEGYLSEPTDWPTFMAKVREGDTAGRLGDALATDRDPGTDQSLEPATALRQAGTTVSASAVDTSLISLFHQATHPSDQATTPDA